MFRLIGLIFKLFFLSTLLLGAAVFFREPVCKFGLEFALKKITTYDSRVESVRVNLLRGDIQAKNITVLNPGEYEERVFADIPEIYAHINIQDLIRWKKFEIYELRFHLREIHVEKSKSGVSNLAFVKALKDKKNAASGKEKLPFYLNRLVLTVREVTYLDRSGPLPKKIAGDAKVENMTFENIRSLKETVRIIVRQMIKDSPLAATGYAALGAGEDLAEGTKQAVEKGKRVIQGAAGGIQDTTDEIGDKLKKVSGTVEEKASAATKKTEEAVKEATESLGKIFSKVKKKVEEAVE